MSRRRKNKKQNVPAQQEVSKAKARRNEKRDPTRNPYFPSALPQIKERAELIIVAVILGVGMLLRFFKIDFQSFWRDEIATISRTMDASSIWALFVEYNVGDPHPPIPFIWLRAWSNIFGHSDAALRMAFAVIGVFSLIAGYFFAKKMFQSAWGRILFNAANSFSLFAIYYAQEVRGYIFVYFFSILLADRFLAWLKQANIKNTVAYAVAAAGIFYSHFNGVVVVAAHGVYLFILIILGRQPLSRLVPTSVKQFKRLHTSWAGTHLISLAMAAPLIWFVLQSLQQHSKTFWMWEPSLKLVKDIFLMYAGFKLPPWGIYPIRTEGIVIGMFIIFALMITIFYLNSGSSSDGKPDEIDEEHNFRAPLLFGLTWVLVGHAVPLVFSIWGEPNVYMPRTVIYALPGYFVILVSLALLLNSGYAYAFVAAILIGPNLGTMPWYYTHHHKQQWRDAVAFIDSKSRPGDVIQHDNRPFPYYTTKADEIVLFEDSHLTTKRRIWVIRELQAGDRGTLNVVQKLQGAGFKPTAVEKFNALAVVLFER